MSFMFRPYPYDDMEAVNPMDASGIQIQEAADGNAAVIRQVVTKAQKIQQEKGSCIVGIDGYTTADFERLKGIACQYLKEQKLAYEFVSCEEWYRPQEELDEMLRDQYLPEDRVKDPVLLYGKIYEGTYEDLMEFSKLAAMVQKIAKFREEKNGILFIIGHGSLCRKLCDSYDYRIYMDVTPMKTMLNLNRGVYKNIGTREPIPFKQMARRCYYVDFELASRERFYLMQERKMDDYILATDPDHFMMMPYSVMNQIFETSMGYPLRCKPVYLEGVWGGYYVQNLRHLPKEMKNCAWVFDLIPMEVSIVFVLEEKRYEFPFYTLVQDQGRKLMGERSVDRFGYYFPVRFNYDDTFHATGNMSIQCHPDEAFVTRENGEIGRQDESYYIVATGHDAKTYLGFNDGIDVDEFLDKIKESEKKGTPVDYQHYVNAVESRPGVQVMIPAGTVHGSGRNQLILEIGSLTVGSYTYKLYDYLRKDFDGKPRPIHSYYGSQVLQKDRKTKWVADNLVNGNEHIVREGEDWLEKVVGEHDLLYFSLRNLKFVRSMEDDTKGTFHVLTLVDGEQVMIRSKANKDRYFIQKYLDIVVVPADFGEYELINLREGTTIVEHKTMLNPDHD